MWCRLYCNVCLLGSLRCGLFCSAVSCAGFIFVFSILIVCDVS